MTARRRQGMRRLVDNTVELVRTGEISPNVAAQKLHENGVPVAVIGRVLSAAIVAKLDAASVMTVDAAAVVKREQVSRPAST